MEKTKFWLIQIVMVAFVSLVFGSPVMAHGDRDHKWSKKSSKRKAYKAEKFHKKLDRKIAWLNKKLGKLKSRQDGQVSKRRHNRLAGKIAWYQKKLDRYVGMLDKHMAQYHVGEEVTEVTSCGQGEELDTATNSCVPVTPVTCDANQMLMLDPATNMCVDTTCESVFGPGWTGLLKDGCTM
jgi:hypothetical protein